MKKILLMLLVALTLLGTVLFFIYRQQVVEHSSQQFLMDTLVSIKVYGKDRDALRHAVNGAFAVMRELAERSDYFPTPGTPAFDASDVCRINQGAGKHPVSVHRDTLAMLLMAQQYAKLSSGAFDTTIGPVMDLWGFGSGKPAVPSPHLLQKKRDLVNWSDIVTDSQAGTVFLRRPGMKVDLGAVAKGFAAEKASQYLRQKGIASALIDAGGTIRTIGKNRQQLPWKIGVKDPQTEGKLAAIVTLEDGSAATSGDYYRVFEQDGQRYHHLLDPHSGYPARYNRSVTVLTRDAGRADILSTAFFVMKPEQALQLAEKLEGVDLVVISADGMLRHTRSLQGRITRTPP